MMECFVCHLTQLEPIDAYAKHKGLMNYNKKTCLSWTSKSIQEVGVVFVAKGYRNPKWKTRDKEEETCPTFSNHKVFWQPMALP
jgi:choline kinase